VGISEIGRRRQGFNKHKPSVERTEHQALGEPVALRLGEDVANGAWEWASIGLGLSSKGAQDLDKFPVASFGRRHSCDSAEASVEAAVAPGVGSPAAMDRCAESHQIFNDKEGERGIHVFAPSKECIQRSFPNGVRD